MMYTKPKNYKDKLKIIKTELRGCRYNIYKTFKKINYKNMFDS